MSITRIAQAANVSYATAWRIINNRPCSSEQAVLAVKRAMGQFGYRPEANQKRNRRTRGEDGIRTHNVALLHLREGTSVSTTILNTVQQALAEQNLNLIFAHGTGPESLPQAIHAGNVDGILGYGQFPTEAVTDKLKKIPAVWMMSRSDTQTDPWGDRVKPDHYTIGELAALHLIARGHKSIGFMNPDSDVTYYQHRLAAFRAAAEREDVALKVYTARGPLDYVEEARRLVDQWSASTSRPTAIFVPVDRVTLHVYRELEQRGILPGKDVEIISCDNERELLSLMHPSPVSVDLNRHTIARLAVDRLLWRMRHGVESTNIVITVTPTLVAPDKNGGGNRNDNGNGNGNGKHTRTLAG